MPGVLPDYTSRKCAGPPLAAVSNTEIPNSGERAVPFLACFWFLLIFLYFWFSIVSHDVSSSASSKGPPCARPFPTCGGCSSLRAENIKTEGNYRPKKAWWNPTWRRVFLGLHSFFFVMERVHLRLRFLVSFNSLEYLAMSVTV